MDVDITEDHIVACFLGWILYALNALRKNPDVLLMHNSISNDLSILSLCYVRICVPSFASSY